MVKTCMQQTSKKLEIEPLPAMPMEAAAHDNEVPSPRPESGNARKVLRSFGLGIITGAADDDPSAVGSYASAGAKFGPSFLWVAPMMFPMMFAVVYLAGKLGQVSGHGLFAV